jgi:hypothetical protein
MKTQRFNAYRELVRQLLECQEGQELALIQANQQLIDADFIQVMREVAAQFAIEGELDAASFLNHWSVELGNALRQNPSEAVVAKRDPRGVASKSSASPAAPSAPSEGDRAQEYMTLIKELLSCRKGSETEILQAHHHLVDQGLVAELGKVAAMLADKGDMADARFLQGVAEQLSGLVAQPHSAQYQQPHQQPHQEQIEQIELLHQLLRAIQTHAESPKMIVQLLTQHADQFNEAFLSALRLWANQVLAQLSPADAMKLAADLVLFSDAIQQVPAKHPAQLLDIAIAGYEIALPRFSSSQFPAQWAIIQTHLGEAHYFQGEAGHPEHIEAAIHCFQDALQVYTHDQFPREWVMVQTELGNAYRQRVQGDRTENLEKAVDAYAAALQVASM